MSTVENITSITTVIIELITLGVGLRIVKKLYQVISDDDPDMMIKARSNIIKLIFVAIIAISFPNLIDVIASFYSSS